VTTLSAIHVGVPSNVTVIGHSYGSTTVADAFAGGGMRSEHAVLIGSPGTDLAKGGASPECSATMFITCPSNADPITVAPCDCVMSARSAASIRF